MREVVISAILLSCASSVMVQANPVAADVVDIRAAYNDVRDDATDTSWALCTYVGKEIELSQTGTDYSDFLSNLQDDIRAYGYVRVLVGDETDRRSKYAFITWIGPGVSPLKKAKVSTDKAFVKQLWSQFQKEILADEKSEVAEAAIVRVVTAAAGAQYGTGKSRRT